MPKPPKANEAVALREAEARVRGRLVSAPTRAARRTRQRPTEVTPPRATSKSHLGSPSPTSIPAPAPKPEPARRTQAERRASTRGVLLEATIATLIDLGYAATTTTLVTRRAGVSQGALFNHFPSKAALVAAAAELLFERLIDQFRAAFARMKPGEDRVSVAIRRLWDVYQEPALPVAYSLYCAAASDHDLADALRPVIQRHGDEIDEAARALFPEIADGPELRSLLDIVVYAMQGLTLQSPIHVDPVRTESMLTQLEALGRLAVSFAPKKHLTHPVTKP